MTIQEIMNYLDRDDVYWYEVPYGEQFNWDDGGEWIGDVNGQRLSTNQLAELIVEQTNEIQQESFQSYE